MQIFFISRFYYYPHVFFYFSTPTTHVSSLKCTHFMPENSSTNSTYTGAGASTMDVAPSTFLMFWSRTDRPPKKFNTPVRVHRQWTLLLQTQGRPQQTTHKYCTPQPGTHSFSKTPTHLLSLVRGPWWHFWIDDWDTRSMQPNNQTPDTSDTPSLQQHPHKTATPPRLQPQKHPPLPNGKVLFFWIEFHFQKIKCTPPTTRHW